MRPSARQTVSTFSFKKVERKNHIADTRYDKRIFSISFI